MQRRSPGGLRKAVAIGRIVAAPKGPRSCSPARRRLECGPLPSRPIAPVRLRGACWSPSLPPPPPPSTRAGRSGECSPWACEPRSASRPRQFAGLWLAIAFQLDAYHGRALSVSGSSADLARRVASWHGAHEPFLTGGTEPASTGSAPDRARSPGGGRSVCALFFALLRGHTAKLFHPTGFYGLTRDPHTAPARQGEHSRLTIFSRAPKSPVASNCHQPLNVAECLKAHDFHGGGRDRILIALTALREFEDDQS